MPTRAAARCWLALTTIHALIHRDYFDPHGEISIRVYDHRVYVRNPGELPPGITVADLKKTPHDSRLRNPLLAQAFYFAGWIERWGSGTTRIVGLCQQQGLPEPEFRSQSGRFEVQFFEDPYTEERLSSMGLNERQVQAVLRAKQGGEISIATLKGLIPGVSDKTIYRDLQNLVELGVLKRSGEKKGSRYVLARGTDIGHTR